MGSGTRTADSWVANQLTLQSAKQKPSLIHSADNLHITNLHLSPSILLFWRSSSHSEDASMLSVSVSVKSPFMPSAHTGLEVALLEVRLDHRRPRDNLILLRCDEWRVVCLLVLFVRFQGVGEVSGHVILQRLKASDLAALRCLTAEIAELARSGMSITLACRAGYLERVMATTAVYSRLFEFHSH